MAKKNFGKGIDAILGDHVKNRNEKKTEEKPVISLSDLEIRTTFLCRPSIMEKIKAVAYWERISIKDVIQDALLKYLDEKGEKNVEEAVANYRASGKSNTANV